jgi:hypothetical protein
MNDRKTNRMAATIIAKEATVRVDQSGIASVDTLHNIEAFYCSVTVV